MPEPQRRCPKCGAAYGRDVIFCPADGAPLSARPLAAAERYLGLTLPGGIELRSLIGAGAMATVFRAHQAGVERDVAVKVLHAEACENETLVARFQREGRAAARIRHPNVIEVHSFGALPEGETARAPYLVLEYLDGLSLRSLLSAGNGTLPLPRALHVVLQVCDALAEAHALGIVHRDLKPENLMLVRRGSDPDFVKVLDFGLSRLDEPEAALETRAGAVLGTARYVSPEGARGEAVDARADVYAIGTILFECLAGRTPFEADSAVTLLVQKSEARAPDVREFEAARATPAALAELIARCLARDPKERPQDGRALGRELARHRVSAASETRLFGSPDPSALSTSPAPPAATPERASTRPAFLRRVAIVAACFLLGASGALGVGTHFGACGR